MVSYGPYPSTVDPNIVIVTITEQLLDRFPYRSPVDRQFLATLLQQLATKHVRAVGVDILFDTATEPAKDEMLRQVIRHYPVPLVISFVEDPREIPASNLAVVRDFVPPENRGMANIVADDDGVMRHIYDGEMGGDGHYIPGLARAILLRLGIPTPNEKPELYYRRDLKSGAQIFTRIPADEVGFMPAALFKNKIVLVGADLAFTDNHLTPFVVNKGEINGSLPGIVIHAHGLAQLLEHLGVHHLALEWAIAVTLLLTALDGTLSRLPIPLYVRFGGSFAIIVIYAAATLIVYYFTTLLLPMVIPMLAVLLAAMGSDAWIGRQERRQRDVIQAQMGAFVPAAIVQQLVDDPSSMSTTGTRRELSLMFTDVANFTTMSESLTSERLTAIINEYLSGVCKIIFQYEGTVSKFIGDAVFALWNAPLLQADHHARIVHCTLAIDAFAERYRAEYVAQGIAFGVTRIGIHAADAVAGMIGASGEIGTPSKMEYTALGDAVNLASRLEGVNKYFGTRLCVSETVVPHVPDVTFRPMAEVIVKGKTTPIAIFEPMDEARVASGLAQAYIDAYAKLTAKDEDAIAAFEALDARFPADPLTRFHLARLRKGETGSLIEMHDK
jgi:class 3 adenylate cyclase/CHASE2 domain-containing sensor protein